MPVIFEFDTTKPFNRGRELGWTRTNACPAMLGKYKGMVVREGFFPGCPIRGKMITPADYDVKAFMYSTHYVGQGWETDVFCAKEHVEEIFGSAFEKYAPAWENESNLSSEV